jgi:hypothetical protein
MYKNGMPKIASFVAVQALRNWPVPALADDSGLDLLQRGNHEVGGFLERLQNGQELASISLERYVWAWE